MCDCGVAASFRYQRWWCATEPKGCSFSCAYSPEPAEPIAGPAPRKAYVEAAKGTGALLTAAAYGPMNHSLLQPFLDTRHAKTYQEDGLNAGHLRLFNAVKEVVDEATLLLLLASRTGQHALASLTLRLQDGLHVGSHRHAVQVAARAYSPEPYQSVWRFKFKAH